MSYSSNQYDKTPSMDADPREIEAWALMKSARQLDNACRDLDNPDLLRDSLRQNQVLWTIFQASVTAEDCMLPPDLRENVLRLSVFIDGRTYTCLGDLDPKNVQALIDINRNVALGLQTNPNEAQDEKTAQPQPTGGLAVTDA